MTTAQWTRNIRTEDPFIGSVFEMKDADSARVEDLVRRAVVALEREEVDKAEGFLRRGLELDSRNPWCRGYLAVCTAAHGRDTDVAVNQALDVVESDPDNPIGQFALGQIYLMAGRRREAFHAFAKSRQLSSRDRLVHSQLTKVEPRRAPVFISMDRDHFLNVIAGRLRCWVERIQGR